MGQIEVLGQYIEQKWLIWMDGECTLSLISWPSTLTYCDHSPRLLTIQSQSTPLKNKQKYRCRNMTEQANKLLVNWNIWQILTRYSSKDISTQNYEKKYQMEKILLGPRLKRIGLLVGLSIGWGCILRSV